MSKCPKCGFEEWTNAKVIKIKIKARAVSGNELKGNTRGAFGWKYRKYRRTFERLLNARVGSNKVLPKHFRRLTLARYFGKRKRAYDSDNLAAGFKPLRDAVVRAGLLVDDSPKWCQVYYEQHPSPTGLDYIMITIEQRDATTPTR